MLTRHTDDYSGDAHETSSVSGKLVRLAHAIAEELIRQGCARLDDTFDRILHGLAEITRADRCFLIQTGGEAGPFRLTHEWHAEHLGPVVPFPGDVSDNFSLLADRMRKRETVRVDSTAQLAERDEANAEELRAHRMGAVLALPLCREGTFWGWLTLATEERETRWDDASIHPIERIASMLAGALEHQRTTRELGERGAMLEQFGNRLWQLHRIQTRSYRDPAALLKAYLEAGCSIFNLQTGIVSRIDGNTYVVQAVTTNLEGLGEGMTYRVGETYCAEVARTGKTVACHHVTATPGTLGHPAYTGLGLESYISTPISVRGKLYGTLNFSSTEPLAESFTLQDRELIELMAESIGSFVELRDTEAERDRLARERSEAEEERHELLQRTEALSSLAVLAAGVAHEINNPLQGMLSHLKALETSLPADGKAHLNAEMVERGIRTIADIVSKLLSLSAEPDQHHERADCSSAAAYVCRLLEPQFVMKGVHIENRVEQLGPLLALEQRELIQVLTNLLLNARDAMPDGGVVYLEADRSADMTHLLVRDTGVGIDPAIRARIFTPFFTTKGRRGTGLGLSVADSIIRGCGGGIEIESELGQGTTCLLRLPHRAENDENRTGSVRA